MLYFLLKNKFLIANKSDLFKKNQCYLTFLQYKQLKRNKKLLTENKCNTWYKLSYRSFNMLNKL